MPESLVLLIKMTKNSPSVQASYSGKKAVLSPESKNETKSVLKFILSFVRHQCLMRNLTSQQGEFVTCAVGHI